MDGHTLVKNPHDGVWPRHLIVFHQHLLSIKVVNSLTKPSKCFLETDSKVEEKVISKSLEVVVVLLADYEARVTTLLHDISW